MSAGVATLPQSTKLALDRTRLAHERTLAAWVRTSTSLISFGFTTYKFFQYMHEDDKALPTHRIGAREFALAMIGLGIVALVLAIIEHRRNLRALRADYGPLPYSLATLVATLLSLMGILGLVVVYFRQ